jgi:arsenite-transporting ATPase
VYDEGMIDDLKQEKARYDAAVKALSDTDTSSFNLVLLPEKLPIDETERAVTDLGGFGIRVRALIVNEIIPQDAIRGNAFLERRRATQERYLNDIGTRFRDIPRAEVPLFDSDIYGLDALRKVGGVLYGR